MDFDTFDERIPDALKIAEDVGLEVEFITEDAVTEHPNTVRINLYDGLGKELEIVGISIGGGTIEITEINSFKLKLSGANPAILVVHQDRFGLISAVTTVLSKYQINIGHMEVSRKEKGDLAVMVIEMDHKIDESVFAELNALEGVTQVIRLVD